MKVGAIYKSREPRGDEFDRVQVAGFIPLSDDSEDLEVSFTAVGGDAGFGPTASTSPEEFLTKFERIDPAVEALEAA